MLAGPDNGVFLFAIRRQAVGPDNFRRLAHDLRKILIKQEWIPTGVLTIPVGILYIVRPKCDKMRHAYSRLGTGERVALKWGPVFYTRFRQRIYPFV